MEWLHPQREKQSGGAQTTVCEQAYAKVNLLLSVGRKRPDGYHDLVSVMQTVTLSDTLQLRTHNCGGISLHCAGVEVPDGRENLAYRAAVKFFSFTEIENKGLDIELTKQIPTQAGLGGGSADAAAVLRGLRRLYAPQMPYGLLEKAAMELGSDVPFCVRGGTAMVQGKGEAVRPLPPLAPVWFLLVKPEEAYATAAMYRQIDTMELWEAGDASAMEEALARQDIRGVCHAMHNTFTRCLPMQSQAPAIVRRLLVLGAESAMLSGSGSAVFGVFCDEERAHEAFAMLRCDYPATFLAEPAKAVQ